MTGFLFNLKPKKDTKESNRKGKHITKGILDLTVPENDLEKKIIIETFEKAKEPSKPEMKVIKPNNLNKKISQVSSQRRSEVKEPIMSNRNDARSSTSTPILHEFEEKGKIIDISHQKEDADDMDTDDYKEVAVEDFGAALLRGMGWKPNKKVEKPKGNMNNRKQGILLGIGAKAIKDEELSEELLSSKNRFSVPMVKRKKTTE